MNTKYETKFFGTVVLKDWMRDLSNRNVMRVTGECELVKDEDYVGFKTRGTEANWAMRVTGAGQQWTILGCQIRAVVAHASGVAKSSDDGLLLCHDANVLISDAREEA